MSAKTPTSSHIGAGCANCYDYETWRYLCAYHEGYRDGYDDGHDDGQTEAAVEHHAPRAGSCTPYPA